MTMTLARKTFAVAGFLGALLLGYVWLSPNQSLEPGSSTAAESLKVPAPKQGQEKVILSGLGMT